MPAAKVQKGRSHGVRGQGGGRAQRSSHSSMLSDTCRRLIQCHRAPVLARGIAIGPFEIILVIGTPAGKGHIIAAATVRGAAQDVEIGTCGAAHREVLHRSRKTGMGVFKVGRLAVAAVAGMQSRSRACGADPDVAIGAFDAQRLGQTAAIA